MPSRPAQPRSQSRTRSLSRLLTALATVLLIGFAARILLGALPPRPFDPAWQWSLSGSLINDAPTALVGTALLHLAAYLDTDDEKLQRRIDGLRRWCTAAAIGFLLLIPLQGLAVVRGLGDASLVQNRQLRQIDQRLDALRQEIRNAPDVATLQRRLPPSLARLVTPEALQQPLPQLRSQLLAIVDQGQQRASARLGASPIRGQVWPVLERCLRVLISAPAYAAGFAAMSIRGDTRFSLLDTLLFSWSRWRQKLGRRAAPAKEEIDYLRKLGRDKDSPGPGKGR